MQIFIVLTCVWLAACIVAGIISLFLDVIDVKKLIIAALVCYVIMWICAGIAYLIILIT